MVRAPLRVNRFLSVSWGGTTTVRSGPATPGWVVMTVLMVFGSSMAAEPGVRAGFAERDISPKIGMEHPGGYGKSYHRAFHDSCKVRASVFASEDLRLAVVSLDALCIERPTVESVRSKIEAATGISAGHVLLAASHSHSSGPLCGVMPGEYDHAPKWVQQLAYEQSTCADAGYVELVETKIVEAVTEANQLCRPVKIGFERGRAEGVAFNRRFLMKSGLSVTHPRQGNPDIVKAAGPVDPEVGVLGVWHPGGRLLGCLVNFACHATTNPPGISANYVYYLERAIRGMFGREVIVVFLNGPSGDVTQVDNLSPRQLPRGEEVARRVGGTVGAEAVKALVRMVPGDIGRLACRQEFLRLQHRQPAPDRVARCKSLLQHPPDQLDATQRTFAKEIVLLDALLQRRNEESVEVQVLQIGPLVIPAFPAEYFCQYGLDLKRASVFPYTFPVALANGSVGYVPTLNAFGPHGGGYETRLTSYSNLEIDAGDRMRDTAIGMIRRLTPGVVPERPPAPKFSGKAWSYGDAPPEKR